MILVNNFHIFFIDTHDYKSTLVWASMRGFVILTVDSWRVGFLKSTK